MLDTLFADTEWIGTDISLEECLWVARKDRSVYVLNDRGDGERWFDTNHELTEQHILECEERIGIDSLRSSCDIYDDYDLLGKFGVIIWYDNMMSEYAGSGMTLVQFAKLIGENPEDYCDSSCEQCECGLDSSVPMGDCDYELSIFPYDNAEYCQECVMLQISYRDELTECQAIIDENVIPIMVENEDLVIWLELVDNYPKSGIQVCTPYHRLDVLWTGDKASMVELVDENVKSLI